MSEPTQKRFIREGRMGPPMSYKTGAVVSTYPKPLLVLEFDTGGLDVVRQPITRIKPSEFLAYSEKPLEQQPPILGVEMAQSKHQELSMVYSSADSVPLITFTEIVNLIVRSKCPWKTVVVDPLTGLTEAILGHIGATNSPAMQDARKWASMVGFKIQQTISVIQGLPCHTVFIMHTATEKNELTGEISTTPMIPSSLRERIGGMFSQFFYAGVEAGNPPKAYVLTQPQGFVKGIGSKTSILPIKSGATFEEIYGSEDKI